MIVYAYNRMEVYDTGITMSEKVNSEIMNGKVILTRVQFRK
jgi:hypothetical protein